MEALQGFVRIGFFIGGGGLVLLFLEPPSSPQWVLSLCSTIVGGVLLVGSVLAYRLLSKR